MRKPTPLPAAVTPQIHPAVANARLVAAMLAMRTRSYLDFQRFMLKVLAPIGSDK